MTDFVEIDGEMKSKGRRRCWCFPYVNLEDVIEQGEDATNYAYECDPQSEIMGCFVSDDEYTQQNIYELMVDVMYEASRARMKVNSMTQSRHATVPYMDYVRVIKQHAPARRVKIADLKHNMNLTRLPKITDANRDVIEFLNIDDLLGKISVADVREFDNFAQTRRPSFMFYYER